MWQMAANSPSTSSVIFSLKELAQMEDERVRAEAEASRLENEAREAARLEEEARQREEIATLEREEAARVREAERSEREAAARVEAIHRAALEVARVEAEARVRADVQERERARELRKLELASAEQGKQAKAARGTALVSLSSAIAVACVAAGLYAAVIVPAERSRAARSAAELASRDALVEDARQEVRKAEEQTRSVAGDLVAARDENARLQAALDAAKRRATPSHPANIAPSHPTTTRARETWSDGFTSCPPDSKDPLCVH
jgi:colicin import membrane protein